jgi:hypothetical protein
MHMTTQNASQVDCKWNYEFLNLTYNSNVETSIGWSLPKYAEIDYLSMMVFVKTIDATETVSIGLLSTEVGGDADGFIDDISIATAGWIRPAATLSQGTNAHYISATTFGVLFLPAACLGANVTEQNAVPLFKNHMGDGVAKSLSYTCSAGSDTFVGVIAFRWRQFPDPTFWRWV